MGSFKLKNFWGIIIISSFVFALMTIIMMLLEKANIITTEIAKNANVYSLIVVLIILIINTHLRISYSKWLWEFKKSDWRILLRDIGTNTTHSKEKK